MVLYFIGLGLADEKDVTVKCVRRVACTTPRFVWTKRSSIHHIR